LAHHLPEHHRAIGARKSLSSGHRDLELVRRVLREEPLGLHACLCERRHQLARERLGATLSLQRERQPRRLLAQQLELVLEAAAHPYVEVALELRQGAAQKLARAARPWLP